MNICYLRLFFYEACASNSKAITTLWCISVTFWRKENEIFTEEWQNMNVNMKVDMKMGVVTDTPKLDMRGTTQKDEIRRTSAETNFTLRSV